MNLYIEQTKLFLSSLCQDGFDAEYSDDQCVKSIAEIDDHVRARSGAAISKLFEEINDRLGDVREYLKDNVAIPQMEERLALYDRWTARYDNDLKRDRMNLSLAQKILVLHKLGILAGLNNQNIPKTKQAAILAALFDLSAQRIRAKLGAIETDGTINRHTAPGIKEDHRTVSEFFRQHGLDKLVEEIEDK